MNKKEDLSECRNIQEKMDYSKRFKSTMKITSTMCNILGVNFEGNLKWNWRTACIVLLDAFCIMCIFYTLYYYRHEFVMCLRFLSSGLDVLQATVKMYSILRYKRIIASLFAFLEEVYSRNINTGSKRARAQLNCVKAHRFCMRVGIITVTCIYIIACTPPFHSYFLLNRKDLFFDILLAGYPPNTNARYIVTLFIQFVAYTTGFIFNSTMDFIILALIVHLLLLTELFSVAFNELGTDSYDCENGFTKLRASLKNCVLMHQDLINYISVLNSYTSPIFFCQISTASISLAANCFCIVKTDWVGAYAFGLSAFIKIFMVCALGTFVEVVSDRMTAAIYDAPWHTLPVDCQKTVMLLLLRSQNFTKFTIAGYAPLNVATGASILKAIYSYLMILLNLDA